MKKTGDTKSKSIKQKADPKLPAFALRAERAFKRVAQKLKAESRTQKKPLVLWEDGKMVEKIP